MFLYAGVSVYDMCSHSFVRTYVFVVCYELVGFGEYLCTSFDYVSISQMSQQSIGTGINSKFKGFHINAAAGGRGWGG